MQYCLNKFYETIKYDIFYSYKNWLEKSLKWQGVGKVLEGSTEGLILLNFLNIH